MKIKSIVLAGGCFWCIDAGYRIIAGVTDVVSGFAGGNPDDATYDKVASGRTGHAEAVRVMFDQTQITLADILEIFWTLHDPTSLNQQGYDIGPQYRSAIFYDNTTQKLAAESAIKSAQAYFDKPIVTKLEKLQGFYPAEDLHQDYYGRNPEQGYCRVIIDPKIAKLHQKFMLRLKQPKPDHA